MVGLHKNRLFSELRFQFLDFRLLVFFVGYTELETFLKKNVFLKLYPKKNIKTLILRMFVQYDLYY